jgi:transmembrane sensor
MDQENIWSLLAKKLSGEATASELTELEQLLRANPEVHYSVQPLIDLWRTDNGPDNTAGHQAFDRHVQRMEDLGIDFSTVETDDQSTQNSATNRNDSDRKALNRKAFRTVLLTIPLLVLTIIAGRMLFSGNNSRQPLPAATDKQPTRALSEISTRNGSKTSLILPDGTKVWLNAGSKLTYDSAFGRTLREVSLSGEGYFDVIRNKQKPFIIHASKINIKVLGTEFDVKSYPSDKTTEASLIRGSIEVTFNGQPSKTVILKPNEKLVIDNFKFENHLAQMTDNPQVKQSVPEIPKAIAVKTLTYENKTGDIIETSWVENKLVFQDESFEEIARKLERWYGVTIRFESERLMKDHLTGSFTNETIRQALDALKFTASFNYSIDSNNNISIY